MRSVCAFANDFVNEGSGYIVIGVEEKDGKPIRPELGFNPDELEKVEKEISILLKPKPPTCNTKVNQYSANISN